MNLRTIVCGLCMAAGAFTAGAQAPAPAADPRDALMARAGIYVPYDIEHIVRQMPSPPASVVRTGRCRDSAPRFAQGDAWQPWQLQTHSLGRFLGLWSMRHFGARAAENLVGGCADHGFMIAAWQAALGARVTGVLRLEEMNLLLRFWRGELDVGKDPAAARAQIAKALGEQPLAPPPALSDAERARRLLTLHHQLPPRADEIAAVLALPRAGPARPLQMAGCSDNGQTFDGPAAEAAWKKRPHGWRMFTFWASFHMGTSAVQIEHHRRCVDMEAITRQWQALTGSPVTGVLTARDIERMRAAWLATLAPCPDPFARGRPAGGAGGGPDVSLLDGAVTQEQVLDTLQRAGCSWNEGDRHIACGPGARFAGLPLQSADVMFDESMALQQLLLRPLPGQQERLAELWSAALGPPEIEITDVEGSLPVERRRLERTDLMPWGRGLAEVDVVSVRTEHIPVYRQRTVLHWKTEMFTGRAEQDWFSLAPAVCRR